jgi:hypothetical protein
MNTRRRLVIALGASALAMPFWGATIILSGRTTIMMAGGEESKAA